MIIVFILCLFNFGTFGQSPSGLTYTPLDVHFSPEGILDTVVDDRGRKFSLGEIAISDTIRGAVKGVMSPSKPSSCTSGYFKMWLESGCGMEKAGHPYSDRLAVLCQVLADISSFIPSALPPGEYVNIWVKPEITSGAGVGSPFYNVPYSSSVSGITDNAIWITINSGRDAFTNVASPLSTSGGGSSGATFFHGSIAFNFDPSIKWHTDLSTPPVAYEADLYTVALHEMMHAMGFGTLIDFDGKSVCGKDYPYYTRYDTKLKSGSSNLITRSASSPSGCDMYGWRFNPSLTPFAVLSPVGTTGTCPSGYQTGAQTDNTVCTTAIKYASSTQTIPVYSPSCFERGCSLSHFEDQCYTIPTDTVTAHPLITDYNNQYFLMSNSSPDISYAFDEATYPGAMKRYLKPEERQVLCDIGYQVNETFGSPANLNYISYGTGTACGQHVAGINDGITITPSGAKYTFVCSSPTATVDINPSFARLLDNDNADGFKCLEVVTGSGTISPDNGTSASPTPIIFTPGSTATGVQLIRYIPYRIVSGVEIDGNITYVYVYVGKGCSPDICNLVSNGGFESGSFPSRSVTDLNCWTEFTETVDVFSRGSTSTVYKLPGSYILCCTGSEIDVHEGTGPGTGITNDHVVGAVCSATPPAFFTESIAQTLATPLIAGNSYTISFWAKIADIYDVAPNHIQFALSPLTTLSPLGGTVTGLPSGLTPLYDFILRHPDHRWQYISQTITCPITANSLVIIPAPYLTPSGYSPYFRETIMMDDIKIEPASISGSFSPPTAMCSSAGTFDLDLYNPFAGTSGGTYRWETIPVGTTPPYTPTRY